MLLRKLIRGASACVLWTFGCSIEMWDVANVLYFIVPTSPGAIKIVSIEYSVQPLVKAAAPQPSKSFVSSSFTTLQIHKAALDQEKLLLQQHVSPVNFVFLYLFESSFDYPHQSGSLTSVSRRSHE